MREKGELGRMPVCPSRLSNFVSYSPNIQTTVWTITLTLASFGLPGFFPHSPQTSQIRLSLAVLSVFPYLCYPTHSERLVFLKDFPGLLCRY